MKIPRYARNDKRGAVGITGVLNDIEEKFFLIFVGVWITISILSF